MSVQGIATVPASTVSTVQSVNGRAAAAAEHDLGNANNLEPERDKATGQPVPPRFPWLSRITRQLEQASNRAPPYSPAPMLGENLDRSA